MFLQTVLGRANTRPLSKPPVGGKWGRPRYNHRLRLPPPISVKDFRKFNNPAHKNGHEAMASCKLLVGMGNATRGCHLDGRACCSLTLKNSTKNKLLIRSSDKRT